MFKIYLPRLDASVSYSAEDEDARRAPPGCETVLLVEDEAMLRDLLHKMLASLGYRVLTASSSHEALEFASSRDGEIDLMVTDVVMPGIGGPELAERLAAIHPETRVLFVSGYTDDAVLRHGVRAGWRRSSRSRSRAMRWRSRSGKCWTPENRCEGARPPREPGKNGVDEGI